MSFEESGRSTSGERNERRLGRLDADAQKAHVLRHHPKRGLAQGDAQHVAAPARDGQARPLQDAGQANRPGGIGVQARVVSRDAGHALRIARLGGQQPRSDRRAHALRPLQSHVVEGSRRRFVTRHEDADRRLDKGVAGLHHIGSAIESRARGLVAADGEFGHRVAPLARAQLEPRVGAGAGLALDGEDVARSEHLVAFGQDAAVGSHARRRGGKRLEIDATDLDGARRRRAVLHGHHVDRVDARLQIDKARERAVGIDLGRAPVHRDPSARLGASRVARLGGVEHAPVHGKLQPQHRPILVVGRLSLGPRGAFERERSGERGGHESTFPRRRFDDDLLRIGSGRTRHEHNREQRPQGEPAKPDMAACGRLAAEHTAASRRTAARRTGTRPPPRSPQLPTIISRPAPRNQVPVW